tara:strand:+ start:193 stop:384 length:192 start_codon:yes stop_codon:yes gene_type:complete
MFTYILVIMISGKEVQSNCEMSLCFDGLDNCFKFERRINNNIGSQITAKCVSIRDYYEKKITT